MLVATKRKRKSPTFVIATFPRDHLMNNRMTEAMMGVRHRWEWRRRLLARRSVCFCVRFLKRGSGVLTCLQSTRDDQPGKKRMSGLNGEIHVDYLQRMSNQDDRFLFLVLSASSFLTLKQAIYPPLTHQTRSWSSVVHGIRIRYTRRGYRWITQ